MNRHHRIAKKSPNILVIMADQLAPRFMGCYGHLVVKTPHLDMLVDRGSRFDAAYCNSPLCAPSRFAFMSGHYISRIAAYDNASEFPASIPTFAHYLKLMGYHTCLSGKMHFIGPDQLHGFEARLNTDIYPADFTWNPDWEQADERIDKWYHNMDAVRAAGVAVATYQMDYDEETVFLAKRKLVDYARSNNAPFCLVASFIHPHDPYVTRQEWWDLYDPGEIDLPATPREAVADDPFTQRLMKGIGADVTPLTHEAIRKARHAYYANISYIDSKVGELVKTLEETGQKDNTIILFTADHGDMLGERGLWYKMNFFEPSARVPLIMAGPGIARQKVATPCSLVDLLPTFLDIAAIGGGEKPSLAFPVDGRSLLSLARGEIDAPGEVFGEYCAEMTAAPVFMIRRGRYKYIHCDMDPPMLFDVTADPLETVNLAQFPEQVAIRAEFADEVACRWDSEAIRRDVIFKQKQRRVVQAVFDKGQASIWDYAPPQCASEQYVRNHMDWPVKAAQTRFPPPDG